MPKPSLTRRRLLAGTAAASALMAAPAIVRAQGGALKVGVLLPRSGAQAGIGQDCLRGVDIAGPILKDLGLPDLQIMNADTETNVEVARARAEKLIADGAQLLMGAFDSGQTTAIAQVAEQKGIPLRHQHRRRAADHRAGLQVRVPQFPDRADDPRRRLRQPEGDLRGDRHGAQDRRVPARQRHVRHRDGAGHRRRPAEIRHAVHDRADDRLRSERARPLGRDHQGAGRRKRTRCWWSAASTTPSC